MIKSKRQKAKSKNKDPKKLLFSYVRPKHEGTLVSISMSLKSTLYLNIVLVCHYFGGKLDAPLL
jgi:hypothetical protein